MVPTTLALAPPLVISYLGAFQNTRESSMSPIGKSFKLFYKLFGLVDSFRLASKPIASKKPRLESNYSEVRFCMYERYLSDLTA